MNACKTIETPVSLLIFHRPDTTETVFEAIRQAKPPKLLVVVDGARSDRLNDKSIVSEKAAQIYLDFFRGFPRSLYALSLR
ncbi:MAG: hypothetical protein QNJ32_19435 [Xenococcaceae cyanobacterium MO_167.B27]|nr:hypothetical protein [Xenococcaceae cyanobacterium MO_167.B27]